MSGGKATHWANVGEAGFAFGMMVLYGINRYLGRWPFRVALAPVVAWYVVSRRIARLSSADYFRRLEAHTGVLGRAPTWLDTFRHMRDFAETLLDKALAIGGRYPMDKLRFEGREAMLESIAQRRGGVLLTAHMGCLEACRVAAEARAGLTLNVLVHTRHAEQFNKVLKRLDPDTHVKLLQVSEFTPATAAMLAAKVEAGEFVVIAADRVPVADTGRTVSVPFLGSPAAFPLGPWVLASALRCQVMFFSVLHHPDGDGYLVQFERFAEQVELPRGQREVAAAGYIARYAEKLESLCRRSPYDWYNFFPFWEKPGA